MHGWMIKGMRVLWFLVSTAILAKVCHALFISDGYSELLWYAQWGGLRCLSRSLHILDPLIVTPHLYCS